MIKATVSKRLIVFSQLIQLESLAVMAPDLWPPNISDWNPVDYGGTSISCSLSPSFILFFLIVCLHFLRGTVVSLVLVLDLYSPFFDFICLAVWASFPNLAKCLQQWMRRLTTWVQINHQQLAVLLRTQTCHELCSCITPIDWRWGVKLTSRQSRFAKESAPHSTQSQCTSFRGPRLWSVACR